MARWLHCLAPFLALLLAASQPIAAQVTAPAGDKAADATAFGRVVDEAGRPIAGAEVEILPKVERREICTWSEEIEEGVSGTSRADGVFELRPLSAGAFSLQARAPGFASAATLVIEVPAAGRRYNLGDILLIPESVVEGWVTDTHGAPLAGARIRAHADSGPGSGTDLFEARRSRRPLETGADGRFQIRGFSEGAKLHVRATAPGYAETEVKEVEVPQSASLRLQLRPLGRVVGQVVDPDGEPVAGARVTESRGSKRDAAITDGQGHFRIETGSGAVELEVRAEGYKARTWRGEVPERGETEPAEIALEHGEVLEGRALDLTLDAGVEISGTVRDAASAPAAGVEVILSAEGGKRYQRVYSAPDGSFRFANVAAGTLRLLARKRDLGSAKQELEAAGRPLQGLDLRLEAGGMVKGRLLGIRPADVAGMYVLAFPAGTPEGARDHLGGKGRVYQSGTYEVLDLPPGDWTVGAMAPGGREVTATVTLAPGMKEAVLDLDLSGDLTLSGVIQVDGAPAYHRAAVVLRSGEQGAGGGSHADAGLDGGFRVTRLTPGTYTLWVQIQSAGPTGPVMILERPFELAADQEIAVDLVTGKVQGRAVSPEGVPVVAARIGLQG
ncbi:MAG TPA: carboxypeptidase-like regulatory domain-containing protein, partial [Thermoanaerobaculia bacterium]|nr:carboxypeptidase-like regulatory domain-containing protein [Thermoanaerobaculia bacterium]